MFSLCQFFKYQKLSSSLSCVRFPCQRSIPVENTLLWNSTWNTTPVLVIIQVGPQVRDYTLEAALVYSFLSVAPSLPFPTISHTQEHHSVTIICTVNTVWVYCGMKSTSWKWVITHSVTFRKQSERDGCLVNVTVSHTAAWITWIVQVLFLVLETSQVRGSLILWSQFMKFLNSESCLIVLKSMCMTVSLFLGALGFFNSALDGWAQCSVGQGSLSPQVLSFSVCLPPLSSGFIALY